MTADATFRDQITGMIALQVALAKMDGHAIDKKACRYNAMAEYCMHVGRCAEPFSKNAALASIADAVGSAIIGDPMHIQGTPIDVSAYTWMEAR